MKKLFYSCAVLGALTIAAVGQPTLASAAGPTQLSAGDMDGITAGGVSAIGKVCINGKCTTRVGKLIKRKPPKKPVIKLPGKIKLPGDILKLPGDILKTLAGTAVIQSNLAANAGISSATSSVTKN